MVDFSLSLLSGDPGNDRPVVASDVEGTLSSGYAWHGMRDFLINNGYHNRYHRFFRRNIYKIIGFRLGLVNREKFKLDWMDGLLKLYAGLTPEEMAQAGRYIADNEIWPNRREAVVAELQHYLDEGHRVIFVSGMFEPFLQGVMANLPGIEGIGTRLIYEDGKFSGEMVGSFNRGRLKADCLQPFLRNGCVAAAFGDTGSDIEMLSLAERPVAVAPDKVLKQKAEQQGWAIIEQ